MNDVFALIVKLLSGVVAALVSYFVIYRTKVRLSNKPDSIRIKLDSGEERELEITSNMTSNEINEKIRQTIERD